MGTGLGSSLDGRVAGRFEVTWRKVRGAGTASGVLASSLGSALSALLDAFWSVKVVPKVPTGEVGSL